VRTTGYHQSPNRWLKGTTPVPIGWIAGEQWDGDLYRADLVLGNLSTYYPGGTDYEVAGFFWWQGDKDSRDEALTGRYEHNLVALIKALRLRYLAFFSLTFARFRSLIYFCTSI
jgi:hypothetical protein